MRINKFLAEKGVASRRGADEMIRSGRVTVTENWRSWERISPKTIKWKRTAFLSLKAKYSMFII